MRSNFFARLVALASGCILAGVLVPDMIWSWNPKRLMATTAPLGASKPRIATENKPTDATGYISALCLNVRERAGTRGKVIGFLFKGDKVQILEDKSLGSGYLWRRVVDSAGFVQGWVYGKYVSAAPVESDFVMPDDYKRQQTPGVSDSLTAKYVGVAACRTCHAKADNGFRLGAYGVWREHYHADAYETLSKKYTRAFAKKRGIDDPLNDWRCRKCHVTALGVAPERLAATYRDEDGVGCEVCHGPGGDYLYSHWEGTEGFEQREAAGFRLLRDLDTRDAFCRTCHNPLSPTYKPFNVVAFSEAIRHWPPDDFDAFAAERKAGVPEAAQAARTRPAPVKPASAPPAQERPAPEQQPKTAPSCRHNPPQSQPPAHSWRALQMRAC